MSALAIFNGRVASIQGKQFNSGYRMTIQLITERSYLDNSGNWVKEPSSFFLTRWGDYNRKVIEEGQIQVGFGLYVETELTRTKGKNGQFYENFNIKSCKVTSKPKTYWDNYNTQNQGNPQDRDVALQQEQDHFVDNTTQEVLNFQDSIPANTGANTSNQEVPQDDDIPF